MKTMVEKLQGAIEYIRDMPESEFRALFGEEDTDSLVNSVEALVPTKPLKHMSVESSGRFEGGFVVAGRKSMSTDSASEKFTSIAEWTEAA